MTEKDPPESSKRGLLTIVVVFGGLFVMFFLFAMVALLAVDDSNFDFGGGERIGVVEVVGPIMDSREVVEQLATYGDDESILGIVVRVDSPGGAVAPSQEIYQAIERAGEKKPIAISMGSTAASGGYYIALGGDRIFANAGTVTGSIGVITQLFDVHQLLETAQVEVNTIKTGPYKDAGSPFRPMELKDEMHFRALIDDVYEQFVEDIARARKMEVAEVKKLADGRVFTGRQAEALALVDEIGSLHDTVAWVAEQAKLEGEPTLVYPPKDEALLDQLIRGSIQSAVAETRASATPVLEYRYIGPQ